MKGYEISVYLDDWKPGPLMADGEPLVSEVRNVGAIIRGPADWRGVRENLKKLNAQAACDIWTTDERERYPGQMDDIREDKTKMALSRLMEGAHDWIKERETGDAGYSD